MRWGACGLCALLAFELGLLAGVSARGLVDTASSDVDTPGGFRSLFSLEEAGAGVPVIAQAADFASLDAAIKGGAQHIEIINHINAISQPLQTATISGQQYKHLLLPQTARTRSITANCSQPPDAEFLRQLSGTAELLPLKQGQCVILAASAVLALTEGDAWVDNIYLRYSRGGDLLTEQPVGTKGPALLHVHSGTAFVTNVTIQGDGESPSEAFWVFPTSDVFVSDTIMSDHVVQLQGQRPAPPIAVVRSPTVFLRSQFSNNTLPPGTGMAHIIVADIGAPVKIQESEFSGNTDVQPLGALGEARFFSDDSSLTIGDLNNGDKGTPTPISRSAGVVDFLDEWHAPYRESINAVTDPLALRLNVEEALEHPNGVGTGTHTAGCFGRDAEINNPLLGQPTNSPEGINLPACGPDGGGAPGTPGTPGQGDAPGTPGTPGEDGAEGSEGIGGAVIGGIIAAAIIAVAVVAGLIYYFNRRKSAQQAKQAGGQKYGPPGGPPPPGAYGQPPPGYGPGPWGSTYGTQPSMAHNPSKGGDYYQGPYANTSSSGGPPIGPGAPGPYHDGATGGSGYGPPPGAAPGHYNVATGAFGNNQQYGALPSMHHANQGPYVPPQQMFPQATYTYDDLTMQSVGTPMTTVTRGSRGSTTRDPGEPVEPLPDGATIDQKIERLHKQLDGMHAIGKPVLGHYEVLSHAHRRQGGQGVVQFARGATDGLDYALKFYVSKSAFDKEGALYKDTTLGALLPKAEAVCGNEDGRETDAHGIALPPFLIMEKGEALDEWSRRAKPDQFQAVAMLANVAKRLESMHEAGYVHRDLKPGNVMWLPRENRWTIIDFGCVARSGDPSNISFSLRYTAPEVILALDRQEKTIIPDPAMDAWALGVMAYELMAGGPAFQVLVDGPKQIVAQLKGDAELPWEGSRANPEVLRKLRTLRAPIMKLLDREPSKRPSMKAFTEMLDDIFGTRTLKST